MMKRTFVDSLCMFDQGSISGKCWHMSMILLFPGMMESNFSVTLCLALTSPKILTKNVLNCRDKKRSEIVTCCNKNSCGVIPNAVAAATYIFGIKKL